MIVRVSSSSYLSIWLFFVFITSFVVSNTVKGTTPAFLFSILSFPFIVFFCKNGKQTYVTLLFFVVTIFIFLQLLSQSLLLILEPPSFDDLILVSDENRAFLRLSIFTQSTYVICSFCLFSYVVIYYRSIHDYYLSLSLIIFSIIGFIFWLSYILFGINVDFISNREYSSGLINPGQFQPIEMAGMQIARFVSLTGEPSMYVYSILPYAIYTFHVDNRKTSLLLFSSLLLTLSGTFVVGCFFYIISLIIFKFNKIVLIRVSVLILFLSIAFTLSTAFKEIINNIIISKLLQENDSGLDRFQSLFKHMVFFWELPFPLMITGMGFGFIRSPDFFSTLLVNTGLLGFSLFSLLVLYPVFKLSSSSNKNVGLKCSLFVIYFILMTSVSEYSYPSFWLILGISYNRLNLSQRILRFK